MNDPFVMAKLVNNEYIVDFSCDFAGKQIVCEAKLDIGAMLSLLPLKTIQFHNSLGVCSSDAESFYIEYKKTLLREGYFGSMRSSSSISDRAVDLKSLSFEELLATPEIVFFREITEICLNDLQLMISPIAGISCDTTGSVLIGMDILKNFDYHQGLSRCNDDEGYIKRGDTIFIGCPRDLINVRYLSTLQKYLGYIPDDKLIKLLSVGKKVKKSDRFMIENYPLLVGVNSEYIKEVVASWNAWFGTKE